MNYTAYLYHHIRLDTNEVFYVGIGINSKSYKTPFKRANSNRNRSKFWHYIVSKAGYKVEIIFENMSRDEACIKESDHIKLYGRRDIETGILVNMTNGGDGLNGHIFTDEHKKRIGIKHKGRVFSDESKKRMSESAKGKKLSSETKRKISEALKGNKYSFGFKHNEETKKKVSLSGIGNKNMLGKHHSEETKKHLSEVLKGRVLSDVHKKNISISRTGKPGPTKGMKLGPMSAERKRNISEAKKKYWNERRNAI